MITVVVTIERPFQFKTLPFVIDVAVTFDDDPFELYDVSDKSSNPTTEQEQLKSIAECIVAKKLDNGELQLFSSNQEKEFRTHALILGKKNDTVQVKYTTFDGIDHLSISSNNPNITAILQKKNLTLKATVKNIYQELGAEKTLELSEDIPKSILNLLQKEKNSATNAKKDRDLVRQKEEFLTKRPIKFPKLIAFPTLKAIEKEGILIQQENAVKELNPYVKKSLLVPFNEQLKFIEIKIKNLEQQLKELIWKEAALNETIRKNKKIASFAQGHLQTARNELENTRKSLEEKINNLRTNLSEAKKIFTEHVTDKYYLYTKHKNTIEFTKQAIITALYNATLDYFKQTLDETIANEEKRKEKIKEFNECFAEIAAVDEYGNVSSVEASYKKFKEKSLLEVLTFINGVLKKCDTGISTRKLNAIQAWLKEANAHCVKAYKEVFSETIYKDQAQKMPFIIEMTWGQLKNINLNVDFNANVEYAFLSASDHDNLKRKWSIIPKGEAIGDRQSDLDTAFSQLTKLDEKVKNFQQYIALKEELEAKKTTASSQKQKIDAAIQSFKTLLESITDQIKDQPVEVQKYVLENIELKLAKSVFNRLPKTSKEDLSKQPWALSIERLHAIPAESEIHSLTKGYEIFATAIATAKENLSSIKEEDIQLEQLAILRSLLDNVGVSVLDKTKLDDVARNNESYTKDNSFLWDYLGFQQQVTDTKNIVAELIQEATEKFRLLTQAKASEKQLEVFNSTQQALNIMMISSFNQIQYQPSQPEQNTNALQQITSTAKLLYNKIIAEYIRIDNEIKDAQKTKQITQQPVIPQENQPNQKEQPPLEEPKNIEVGADDSLTAKKTLSLPTKTSLPITESKIRVIYNKYWYKLFVKYKAEEMGQLRNFIDFNSIKHLKKPELGKKEEIIDYSLINPGIEAKAKNKEEEIIHYSMTLANKSEGYRIKFEDFKRVQMQHTNGTVENSSAVGYLEEIKVLIEKIPWKTGVLGSKSKIEVDGMIKDVPNHIYEIYKRAKHGIENPDQAANAMEEINKIATKASNHMPRFFKDLRKRDDLTQEAYQDIAGLVLN